MCVYVWTTSNGNSLVRLCPAQRRKKVEKKGRKREGRPRPVLAPPNQSECPSTLWDFERPVSTYLHMYRYVCLCVCVCVRNTQQADPNARAKCQRLSLCLHAAALAWPDLAPARPSLAWPGLARTMAGFEHSNEFHNIRGKSTCTTARQRLSLSLKELVKKKTILSALYRKILSGFKWYMNFAYHAAYYI